MAGSVPRPPGAAVWCVLCLGRSVNPLDDGRPAYRATDGGTYRGVPICASCRTRRLPDIEREAGEQWARDEREWIAGIVRDYGPGRRPAADRPVSAPPPGAGPPAPESTPPSGDVPTTPAPAGASGDLSRLMAAAAQVQVDEQQLAQEIYDLHFGPQRVPWTELADRYNKRDYRTIKAIAARASDKSKGPVPARRRRVGPREGGAAGGRDRLRGGGPAGAPGGGALLERS